MITEDLVDSYGPGFYGHRFEEQFFGEGLHSGILFTRVSDATYIESLGSDVFFRYCRYYPQRRFYGLHPKKPKTVFSKRLFNMIKHLLPPKIRERLEMFCTLGTSLDKAGVDLLFRIKTGKKTVQYVAVDLTANTQKFIPKHPGVLILQGELFLPGNNTELQRFAKKIADKLKFASFP
jgi:hypothetical protein